MKSATLKAVLFTLVFVVAGSVSSVFAQGNPAWVTKAEQNGVTISAAVISGCHGSDIILYRVNNSTNAKVEVNFTIDYNQNATVINDAKLVIVNPNSSFTPTCDQAAMGMSEIFSMIPQNATIDLSQLSIEIQ